MGNEAKTPEQRFLESLQPCGRTFQQILDDPVPVTENMVLVGMRGILQPFDDFFEWRP